jgi:hypothetical protein
MSFGLQLHWLLSSTPVTYFSKLLRMKLLAALLQPEIQMGMSVQEGQRTFNNGYQV